jgi:hypothetical protein
MIDPHNITNFARTDAELEELILFSVSLFRGTFAVLIELLTRRFKWTTAKTVVFVRRLSLYLRFIPRQAGSSVLQPHALSAV